MPGSSLWLVPLTTSPLDSFLTHLISQTALFFSSPHTFLPHITLTSDIDPAVYGSDPQTWLENLSFPSGENVRIKLQQMESESTFFKKLYLAVEKSNGLKDVAQVARQTVDGYGSVEEAKGWVEESYRPHLSLLYHDIPQVSQEDIADISKILDDVGVGLKGEGELGGWQGGKVVLVPTDKAIKDWNPIAEREL
ncbi:2',3'-cyclic-nucleotide 3'-phosphodiesteras-like protein [Amniculicola lignicola CBS 123094]|uniref:2',3'-cyclic-nucleotide 3'-phosphodiesteras-like protein n=1 Tax=Amniculicola lignicola CBS 123094 TaxID=1392246 RepID=A0A6A5W684_9PLEO|nr:2',3'-cyclic-nucleotide 3'-phosphodiesteras-like protein [Amniculicola lignicola CBS 123094]